MKTTVRFHFSPARKTIIEEKKSAGEDAGRREKKHLYPAGGNGNRYGESLKKSKIRLKLDPPYNSFI